MTASPGSLTIGPADLADPGTCAAIEAFVAAHPESTPFHRPAWLRAVEQGCGQRGHYLVAMDEPGDIAGLLPLTEIRSRLFGNALVSSGFAVGGGILARDVAAIEPLTRAMAAAAAASGCPTLELRGGPVVGPEWQLDEETYLGFARPLAADDEAELKAIPRKQRAEVRKALAADLSITIDRDRRAHYAIYAESVRNLGTPVFPRVLFRAMLDAFGENADVLTVRHQGQPVASVLSLYHGGTVYPYWGGGTAAARGLRANDAMYFALLRHARERGCTRFDFGRSKAGTGPAAFKKNWGFAPEPLRYARRALGSAAVREVNPLSPRFRMQVAAWKKLPLPIANLLGPMLSRGLG